MRISVALAVLAVAAEAHAEPAPVEWTWWLGVGGGRAHQVEEDRDTYVFGFRLGAGVDFPLVQLSNPWHHGGKLEFRWGPWLVGEARQDSQYFQGGLAVDFGQTRHAQFGTYTLRAGGGTDTDGRPLGSISFLGGIRYVPARSKSPKVARASGGRIFGMAMTDFEGGHSVIVGFELEPTWAIPPYSLHKLAGMND